MILINNDARYDLNDRNANMVENEEPAITVFTHGWNGHASTFLDSNKDTKNTSLVTKFDEIIKDSYVYVSKFPDSIDRFELEEISNEFKISDEENVISLDNGKLSDISKHIVIIFDGYNTFDGHDFIYTQFNIKEDTTP